MHNLPWLPTGLPRLRRQPQLPRLRRLENHPRLVGAVRSAVVVLGLEGEQGHIGVNVELGHNVGEASRHFLDNLVDAPAKGPAAPTK